MEKLRLFVAVNLSDECKARLGELLARLKRLDSSVKWVPPENLHITLKFLGEVPEGKAEGIKSALEEISRQVAPFEIVIGGLGRFPEKGKARVIWVGVKEGEKELARLAGMVEEAMVKLGFPKERREFVGHITLGRAKAPPSGALMRFLQHPEGVPEERQEVREVALMRSLLHPEGARYILLASFPLRGG